MNAQSTERRRQQWRNLELYVPHRPWLRQMLFLTLDCLEAFYGGAAGGGKSEALLMAALQYVHVPGYSALIIRRDTQRLRLAGGLLSRSHEWLTDKGPKWSASKNQWRFPTSGAPATITFGYLDNSFDKFRYASSEYQFIAFDELTEFAEEDYRFLFSRLRRRRDIDVPLRMRSASNPGGRGHDWVKRRFIPDDANPRALILWKDGAAYVPAQLRDNPAIDADEYARSLAHLPPLWRERLLHGDWEASERGIVQAEWLRDYIADGDLLTLFDHEGKFVAQVDRRALRRFMTVDPAGTESRAPAASDRSASAIQVWEVSRLANAPYLILIAAYHEQLAFDQLCARIVELTREWRPALVRIENDKFGVAASRILKDKAPMQLAPTAGKSKIERAAALLRKLERGEVYFPRLRTPGVDRLIYELLRWDGENHASCDQIDAAAYAAQFSPEPQAIFNILPLVVR